jgi:hypothetical protein
MAPIKTRALSLQFRNEFLSCASLDFKSFQVLIQQANELLTVKFGLFAS